MSKKSVTYVPAAAIYATIEGLGFIERPGEDELPAGSYRKMKSGWCKVQGPHGRQAYFPHTGNCGRIALSALGDLVDGLPGVEALGARSYGSVTHLVDQRDRPAEDVLGTLVEALDAMMAADGPAPRQPQAGRAAKAGPSAEAIRTLASRVLGESGELADRVRRRLGILPAPQVAEEQAGIVEEEAQGAE